MPSLLYIGQTPSHGTGSPVIILRHLRRLTDAGWKIRVLAENGQDVSACRDAGWAVHTLPHRRAWWPPYRQHEGLLRTARTFLLGRECLRLTRAEPPDAIFGYLAAHCDFFPEIATHFSRQSKRPFSLLIHDDAVAFETDPQKIQRLRRRHRWIINGAHRAWFVSSELAGAYGVPPSEARVLWPIPEGWDRPASWQSKFSSRPRIYYAGAVWPAQLPLMERIAHVLDQAGARLVLMAAPSPEVTALANSAPLEHRPLFRTNREALQHLTSEAAGLLVSYADTVQAMPWIATSFPSKLIEYSHLGLPVAVVAPADSSVGHWAASRRYPDFFLPTALDQLAAWARALQREDSWTARQRPPATLASGEFSPAKIQAQFVDGLLPSHP